MSIFRQGNALDHGQRPLTTFKAINQASGFRGGYYAIVKGYFPLAETQDPAHALQLLPGLAANALVLAPVAGHFQDSNKRGYIIDFFHHHFSAGIEEPVHSDVVSLNRKDDDWRSQSSSPSLSHNFQSAAVVLGIQEEQVKLVWL